MLMPDLNQPAHSLPSGPKKLFLVAGWYSCITPFVAIVALLLGTFGGLFDDTGTNGRTINAPAQGEFALIIGWVFVSSLVSGIVSLFGITKNGARQILLKATIGIVFSICCVFFF